MTKLIMRQNKLQISITLVYIIILMCTIKLKCTIQNVFGKSLLVLPDGILIILWSCLLSVLATLPSRYAYNLISVYFFLISGSAIG